MQKLTIILSLITFSLLSSGIIAQNISGVVTDEEGIPLIGATILETRTFNGTLSDNEGKFELKTLSLPTFLTISYTGYVQQNVLANGEGELKIILVEGTALDEVVVLGTRGKARTILGSAVPIDNINAADLRASGQNTVEQMLNFKVPSYNSSNQTVSDATAHFDPSELRNLGPSRTLVLVNGKRKTKVL